MAFTPAPTAGHDSITGAAASGALDVLAGDDSLEATIAGAVTIIGNVGEDDIEVTGRCRHPDLRQRRRRRHRGHHGRHGDDLRRLGDRRSGRRRRQHRRRRRGRLPDLRQRPGRLHRRSSSHDEGSDTVFGGNGNDSILYFRDGNDDSEALIFGGEQQDAITRRHLRLGDGVRRRDHGRSGGRRRHHPGRRRQRHQRGPGLRQRRRGRRRRSTSAAT